VAVVIATLIIVVCLAADPSICREERPPVDMGEGLSCIMQGQQIAARWLDEHPKWTLRGWRCRIGGGGNDT
jgi:hypothetical protein